MSDTTSSADGVVTPETEVDPSTVTDDTTNGTTADDDDAPELDEDGNPIAAEPVDDTEEIDYEGGKYRIPKPLKDAVLRHADYTRKTQALADERRAFEAQRTASLAANKQYDEARVKVGVIDAHLAQYQNVDWATLEQQDPVTAQQHWRIFSQLKEEKAQAEQAANHAKQTIDADTQRERAKRAAEVSAQLPKIVPGWNAETDAKVAKYGVSLGYSPAELAEATLHNPIAAAVLHKAMQWDEHVSKIAKSKKLTTNAQAKPAAEVGSKAVAAKDPDKMTSKEWMDWRNKQVAKKGR